MAAKPRRLAPTLPAGAPGRWEVTLGRQTATLNSLINARHWAVRGRLKSADKALVYRACLLAGVTRAAGRRRVGLVVVLGPRQRGFDPDSPWKSVLDSLAACGALVDDDRRHVELVPPVYRRGPVKDMVVLIEDVK